jgi:hypothetical protein
MSGSTFNVSGLTPRVQRFFDLWFVAEDRYVYAEKFLEKDFREQNRDVNREGFIRILDDAQSKYDEAREAQLEAHPDAHLMLMLKVKGGWLARLWAQVKGAKQWKHSIEQFDKNYESFIHFYRRMLITDLWAA